MRLELNAFAQGTIALSATLFVAGLASAQCNTTCPVGGIPQNDLCENVGSDPNGGCNFDPVAYQDIGVVSLGSPKTVCGTIGTWGDASRDLDWYRFTLTSPARVQVTMVHTTGGTPGPGTPLPNATIFIRNGDNCATAVTEFAAASGACPFVSPEVVLPAGNHVVIFTVNAFAPNAPACPNAYTGTIAVTALVPAECGTATNSCAEESATGGCSDLACCADVCEVFASCCSSAWDALCVEIAIDVCGIFVYECNTTGLSPVNDCATDATKALLDTPYVFNTTNANTDGPQNEPCDQTRDVWYLVFAEDDGELTIDVSSPTFDSTIGVYAVGETQTFNPEELPLLFIGCVDVLAEGGELAILTDAAANNWYLIRIAGFANQAGAGEVEFRFRRLVFNTGNTFPVNFDSTNQGNYTLTNLGWSSGSLNAANAQRWAAQAFAISNPGAGLIWNLTSIHAYGFSPAGVQNDTLNFRIWTRNGFANPNGETQVAVGSVPFPPPFNIPGGAANEDHEIDLTANPIEIATGNYWLTVYAGGVNAPTPPANFAWFTNAQEGIPTVDGSGNPFMWRSQLFPTPGFLVYTLPGTTLQQQAGLDPLNIYNAGFRILGVKAAVPPPACPWDLNDDGCVNGADLGILLGLWDIEYDGGDLGQLLGAWGPCEGVPPANCAL